MDTIHDNIVNIIDEKPVEKPKKRKEPTQKSCMNPKGILHASSTNPTCLLKYPWEYVRSPTRNLKASQKHPKCFLQYSERNPFKQPKGTLKVAYKIPKGILEES